MSEANLQNASGGSYYIVALKGVLKGQAFRLSPGDSFVIGRDPKSCSIVFPAEATSVSREHCTVSNKNGTVELTDLDSRNHTFVVSADMNSGLTPGVATTLPDGAEFCVGSQKNVFMACYVPTGGALIIATGGTYDGGLFRLGSGEELVFGRDASQCGAVLPAGETMISERHCSAFVYKRGVTLTDCGSSNGTYLGDGSRIEPSAPAMLKSGDVFRLASGAEVFRVYFGDGANAIPQNYSAQTGRPKSRAFAIIGSIAAAIIIVLAVVLALLGKTSDPAIEAGLGSTPDAVVPAPSAVLTPENVSSGVYIYRNGGCEELVAANTGNHTINFSSGTCCCFLPIEDDDIPVIDSNAQLIIVGLNADILEISQVVDGGYTLPIIVTEGGCIVKDCTLISYTMPSAVGHLEGSVSFVTPIDEINGVPVDSYQNNPLTYVSTETNHHDSGDPNSIPYLSENELVTFGLFKGTDFVSFEVSACVRYYRYSSHNSITLNVEKTRDGYFIADTSMLSSGTYVITSITTNGSDGFYKKSLFTIP